MTQDVQPLTWQKRTNLEEHQQFFSKINEIIDNLAPTVDEAEAAIAQATAAIASANDAVATANAASAAASAAASQAQTAASTVAGYDTRMTAAESKNSQQDTSIAALQNVQADYVKKAGAAQTVTSQIMVPTTATGLRDTQIANGTRIQNDLDAYAPMIRTTGAQCKKGVLTLDDGIVAIPAGWHSTRKTGQNIGEYCIFAKVTSSPGRYEVVDFIQGSNTATAYGRLVFRAHSDGPVPVWAMRATRGTNNPLSATSIVILSDGTDLYLAWKKETSYGNLVCRLVADVIYGSTPTESNITWYGLNDSIIVTDLSAYTVYEVEG